MVQLGIEELGQFAAILAEPFVSLSSRTGIAVMAAGWLIGLVAFRLYRGRGRAGVIAYLRYAFPRHVYFSRSFALDLQLLLLNRALEPARWLLGGLGVSATALWLAQLAAGPATGDARAALGTGALVALSACLLLAYDFGTYLTHRLSHSVPVLWAFHRVHHSAETLNPLTVQRKHPVYDMLAIVTDCIVVAPIQAVILVMWGAAASNVTVAWTNFGFGIFAYAASSLRHTHIWLSFGPAVGRVLVSPALHQIHHSRAQRHWDRNYGEVLAVWDWLFGTLYLPRQREELEFGLAGEAEQPHRNLGSALLEPFAYSWAKRPRKRRLRRGPLEPQP